MGVIRRHDRCVSCGSRDFDEIARAEAGELLGIDEDMAIYRCRVCGAEWDNVNDADVQYSD